MPTNILTSSIQTKLGSAALHVLLHSKNLREFEFKPIGSSTLTVNSNRNKENRKLYTLRTRMQTNRKLYSLLSTLIEQESRGIYRESQDCKK